MEEKKQSILNKIWTDPGNPAGYGGVTSLLQQAKKQNPKIKRKDVKQFLQANLIYTLHKPRRLIYKRESYIAAGYMTDCQVDLGDFQKLAKHNKGHRYLLVAIDVLSRRVFLAPTKSKSTEPMKEAFDDLFEKMPQLPQRVFSDRGLEFESKQMKAYFLSKGIHKYASSASVIKAGMAELAIRRVKQRLYRHFSSQKTLNWIDVIDKIANGINNSFCRVTGMTPNQVTPENAQELWNKLYQNIFDKSHIKAENYKADNSVRVAKQKGVFDKGYLPTHSDRIYKIQDVKKGDPTTYRIEDEEGDSVPGKFYGPEFSKTKDPDDQTNYRIEKVVRTRTKNGVKQLYVKFFGFKDCQWIDASTVI